jgi:hypothetical protein
MEARETLAQLLASYPSVPPRLIEQWHAARTEYDYCGNRWIEAGKPRFGTFFHQMNDAEREEQRLAERVFQFRMRKQ